MAYFPLSVTLSCSFGFVFIISLRKIWPYTPIPTLSMYDTMKEKEQSLKLAAPKQFTVLVLQECSLCPLHYCLTSNPVWGDGKITIGLKPATLVCP